MADQEHPVGTQKARDVSARGAEQVRVHALADQRFRLHGVARDGVYRVAHHRDGGERDGARGALRRRGRQGRRGQGRGQQGAAGDG